MQGSRSLGGPRVPQVYNAEAAPVENFFREMGTLVDFNIYGAPPPPQPPKT